MMKVLLAVLFALPVYAQEMVPIADLLPTMYYIPQEKNVDCAGTYRGVNYNGSEVSQILDVNNQLMATVCTRFYQFLLLEGSAILKDRGFGEVGINYAARVGEERRFRYLHRCVLGEGVDADLCLLPYHTLAADNNVHKIDEIIYIPKAQGLLLPDGTIHDGYFIVRDTGAAFNGVGSQRVDMFVGTELDTANVFQRAGFAPSKPLKAFKVHGDEAEAVRLKLKTQFGDLY